MPSVFISYRRQDTSGYAGRIHETLVKEFGKASVFIDVDAIPAGADFVDHLQSKFAGCDVILVLMGRDWASVKDASGRRRLERCSRCSETRSPAPTRSAPAPLTGGHGYRASHPAARSSARATVWRS
jgi:hypothetical protein